MQLSRSDDGPALYFIIFEKHQPALRPNWSNKLTMDGRLIQLPQKVEHFGRNILIDSALINRAQGVGDLTLILTGRGAPLGRGIASHTRLRGGGADIFPVPSLHIPFRR
ncbi:hypothetical protein EP837_00594 [Sphingobium sp. EP60837]|nr:hypothetical protein EP837_00594 [Sphingobium sp. EP60837]